jgi:4-hydroxybenzoyl-CoA reductase subunit beta
VRLPPFEYLEPKDLGETLDLLAHHREQASLLAGGTDLLVRMKRRLERPPFLISLKGLSQLRYIREQSDHLAIGAMTPLASILDSHVIANRYPALHQAVQRIGAATIQHFRGTIGGNLCLQTRCVFYNQSAFWRSGRSPCHKDHGQTCYAEENSDRCRSANQSDGACALTALDAGIVLTSKRGQRVLKTETFFTGKGEAPFARDPDEMVTEIRLPLFRDGEGSSFKKLTYRSAVDFGLVSAAVALKLDGKAISGARLVIGSAGAAPLLLMEASGLLIGKTSSDREGIEQAALQASKHASAFMVQNLGSTLEYRRKMAGVLAKRAIREALTRARQTYGESPEAKGM